MQTLSKTGLAKTVTGAFAAALLTTAVATPAEAQRYRRDYDRGNGISLGDVVLGTIIVGGVASAIGALGNRDRYTRGYPSDRYGRYDRDDGYGSRQASVEACAYAAQREASNRYGGRAQVRDIDDVDSRGGDYRVRGTLEVQSDYRNDRRYSRDGYGRGEQRVQFSCTARGNRVVGLNIGSNYAYGY